MYFSSDEKTIILAKTYTHFDLTSGYQEILYRVEVNGNCGLVFKINSDYFEAAPLVLLPPKFENIEVQQLEEELYAIWVNGKRIGCFSFKNKHIGLEVEADSLDEARKIILAQLPEGLKIVEENIISDIKGVARGVGFDRKEAASEARKNVPRNAKVISEKASLEPKTAIRNIEAFSEKSAQQKAELRVDNIDTDWKVQHIELISLGKKGFLGIGKKPNRYKVEVLGNYPAVELEWENKAVIYAKIGEA